MRHNCIVCGKWIRKERFPTKTCDGCEYVRPPSDRIDHSRIAMSERRNPCQGMSVASDELHKIHPFGRW